MNRLLVRLITVNIVVIVRCCEVFWWFCSCLMTSLTSVVILLADQFSREFRWLGWSLLGKLECKLRIISTRLSHIRPYLEWDWLTLRLWIVDVLLVSLFHLSGRSIFDLLLVSLWRRLFIILLSCWWLVVLRRRGLMRFLPWMFIECVTRLRVIISILVLLREVMRNISTYSRNCSHCQNNGVLQ